MEGRRQKRLSQPLPVSDYSFRNATSTTSTQREIMRNMRYISELRRKIRRLEQEDAELKQRLNMILADFDENITENNQLAYLQQEVEHKLQVQESLNFAMEEENNELRRIICQQQLLPGEDVNNNPIEPSTNQAEENDQDADLKPKE